MYGLTEAFRSTCLEPEELQARPDSIGKAVPNQVIRVLRPDGSACVAGEVGELVHRGSFVAHGYWGDHQQTAERFRPLPSGLAGEVLAETAVWSGDYVRQDEDGYLYFVGRKDSLIKTSGMRVSPTEIEEAICEIDGVLEALAFGLADQVLGQRIVVAFVPRSSSDPQLLAKAILAHCRAVLPSYMIPSAVVPRTDFPRTPSGKLDRRAAAWLMEQAAQPLVPDSSLRQLS